MSEAKKAPSPKAIDELIETYAAAQAELVTAKNAASQKAEVVDELKGRLVSMVETYGSPHAEKSRRLRGARHHATTTTGTQTEVVDERVEDFRQALGDKAMPKGLLGKFFVRSVTYTMVKGPDQVLRGLKLTDKLRERVQGLVALCFRVTTKNPSLKVDIGGAAS